VRPAPEPQTTVSHDNPPRGVCGHAVVWLRRINQAAAVIGAIATGAAACVLTWEATARYLFKIPSD
jgi:hypothetical protein